MSTHSTIFERHAPSASAVEESLRSTRSSGFWLEDASQVTSPLLTASHAADLAVAGGGYTGLWAAVVAKRRDPSVRVVLLEAQTIGWAASGRNGGFAEASLTHGEGNGRTRWPGEINTLERMGLENLDAVARDVAELGVDAQFERTGTLSFAYEPHQVKWLREADAGEYLDREAAQKAITSPVFAAGRKVGDHCALVHPGRLASELGRVVVELGVEIFEHSSVTGMRMWSALVDVETALVRSEKVALGTNVVRPLLRRSRLSTVPVYDYVLMSESLSDALMDDIGWRGREGLSGLANPFHHSRLSADNRILYAGYDAIYRAGRRVRRKYENRGSSYCTLASDFLTTFPQLEGLGFNHQWGGEISIPPAAGAVVQLRASDCTRWVIYENHPQDTCPLARLLEGTTS